MELANDNQKRMDCCLFKMLSWMFITSLNKVRRALCCSSSTQIHQDVVRLNSPYLDRTCILISGCSDIHNLIAQGLSKIPCLCNPPALTLPKKFSISC